MLSIVIPTHHRSDLLRACLAAVRRHAPADAEVIVVDDASPGGAASDVARPIGDRVVRLARQSGFARAANAGIRASRGDVVELLNDDTEVQPGWADAALAHFADPAVGAVAPLVLVWPDGERIDSAGDRYYVGGVAGKHGHGRPLGPAYLAARPVFGASASSGFYRRAALDRVGLFPEDFGSYFEDVDLALRLQRGGYRAMYEPASRVLHHVSASYGTTGRRLIERQSRNEERVFWRNLPTRDLWRALPRHAAVLTGKRVTLAWTLMAGVNTSADDARRLAALTKDLPIVLDLIDVNDPTGRFRPPTADELGAFRDALTAEVGMPVVRRYSGGQDVAGGCGMLAGRVASPARAGGITG
jgi:GT2 family glycosyltransferase